MNNVVVAGVVVGRGDHGKNEKRKQWCIYPWYLDKYGVGRGGWGVERWTELTSNWKKWKLRELFDKYDI